MQPDSFGYVAAILTTIAFLPQLLRTFITKSANDVSLLLLILFIIGLLFWIIYALQSNALPVLIANVITLVLNLSILSLKLIYRNG